MLDVTREKMHVIKGFNKKLIRFARHIIPLHCQYITDKHAKLNPKDARASSDYRLEIKPFQSAVLASDL